MPSPLFGKTNHLAKKTTTICVCGVVEDLAVWPHNTEDYNYVRYLATVAAHLPVRIVDKPRTAQDPISSATPGVEN